MTYERTNRAVEKIKLLMHRRWFKPLPKRAPIAPERHEPQYLMPGRASEKWRRQEEQRLAVK